MSPRCSFCRNYGHNIKRCNSPQIVDCEQSILLHRNDNLSSPELFLEYLYTLDPELIHVIAVKHCNVYSSTRRNINCQEICIQAIYSHYFNITTNQVYFQFSS
jgi:hypothetical protein